MKTIVKTQTIETKYEEYEASDGTVFGSSEQCEKYEKTIRCAILTKLNPFIINKISEDTFLFGCGSEEYDVYIIDVKTDIAYTLVIQLLNSMWPNLFDEKERKNNERLQKKYYKIISTLEESHNRSGDYIVISLNSYENSICFYGGLKEMSDIILSYGKPKTE